MCSRSRGWARRLPVPPPARAHNASDGAARSPTHTAVTLSGWLIFVLWFALVAYWGLAAARRRRSTASRWIWWREIAVRLGFFALVLLALRVALETHALPPAPRYAFNTSIIMGLIGFVLCALGVGLAILARSHLERNGRSRHENPELVTSGPYSLVRHPIFGGMLLAILGSAIGQSLFWLLPLMAYGPHFVLSARREEKSLIVQFPENYRSYMQRTRMLLPFVL
jgi:protein-S-isoprenylcysteine O-methyltransferase Ste14